MKMIKYGSSLNHISEDVNFWIKLKGLLKGTVKNVFEVAFFFNPGGSLHMGYIHCYSICFINFTWFVFFFILI